jgi:competence protein ComEC
MAAMPAFSLKDFILADFSSFPNASFSVYANNLRKLGARNPPANCLPDSGKSSRCGGRPYIHRRNALGLTPIEHFQISGAMQAEPPSVRQSFDRPSSPPLSAGLGRLPLGRTPLGRIPLFQIPLFHAAWLFAAGITLDHWISLRPSLVLVALGLLAVLCAFAAFRAQRIVWLPLAVLWCLLGAWCAHMEPHPAPAPAIAALSDGLSRTVEGTIIDAAPLRSELEQDLDDPATPERPSQRIDLRVSTLEVVTDPADIQLPAQGNVRLTVRWPQPDAAFPTHLAVQTFHCGDRIRAQVRLLQPEIYRDPGVWSREDFLLDQGITSTAAVNSNQVESQGAAPGFFLRCGLSALQHASTARLLALPAAMRRLPPFFRLSPDDAVMLSAMVAGDRTYLTPSLRVGFERTGSFHMLVVSGFHLAIVAACVLWVTRRLRIPRVPATLLTIAASFTYALFTGFATPVQRSLWMVTLYLLTRLVYRERNPLNTIGFASLCLLVASPRSLFESSLQMTLLAVFAIAGIALPLLATTIHPYISATRDLGLTAIDAKLPPKIAHFRVMLRLFCGVFEQETRANSREMSDPLPHPGDAEADPQLLLPGSSELPPADSPHLAADRNFVIASAVRMIPATVRFVFRLLELLVVSCVVELAMTLPMAIYFHRITIFALPVNLFILPLLLLLMPAALVTLIAALLWPPAAVVPAIFVALPLHFGVWLVHLFGSFALGDFRIPAPPLWQSAAFCALLAAAMLLARGSGWRRRATWPCLLLAALAAVGPRPVLHPHNALLVEAIDVGQGDSLLLIAPDGKTLLVDGGGFGGGPHQVPQDFDIGEEVVSEVLWSRGIRHLDVVVLTHAHADHMGGLPSVLRNFHPAELWVGNNPRFGLYNALLTQAANLHVRVRSFRAGDTFPFGDTQIAVLAPFRDYQPGPEPANNDSLVLHVTYGATSVLLEGDAEAPIEQAMLAEPGLQSTLLKVGHHGSLTSTRPEFLARVAPQWAVISCGLHNRYGHPRQEVLHELEDAKVRTYATDINGAVCFELNGESLSADPTCGWTQGP